MQNTVTAESIIRYMLSLGQHVDYDGGLNIVYAEGSNQDLTPNADTPNRWNDRRMIIQRYGGAWHIVFNTDATTEPGKFYTNNPMNPLGAARIAFGQYEAWQFGLHQGVQPALVQVLPVKVHRDMNKDGKRSPTDPIEIGIFGINQHTTKAGVTPAFVDRYSAGCLVGLNVPLHTKFLSLLKQEYRYKKNKKYIFETAILDGSKLYNFALR